MCRAVRSHCVLKEIESGQRELNWVMQYEDHNLEKNSLFSQRWSSSHPRLYIRGEYFGDLENKTSAPDQSEQTVSVWRQGRKIKVPTLSLLATLLD
jgi:hypothetical protein